MTALAPVIYLDPIGAGCGCAPGPCGGHQPTPAKADRRHGYRKAAEVLDLADDDSDHVAALAELLRACADLCIPAAHPTAPNPHDVVRRLLGAADVVANALLPEGIEDEDEGEEVEEA